MASLAQVENDFGQHKSAGAPCSPSILSVGVDPTLTLTRTAVLECCTLGTVKAATPAQAFVTLTDQAYDLVVICHSVSQADFQSMLMELIQSSAKTKVLLFDSVFHRPYSASSVALEFGTSGRLHRIPNTSTPAELVQCVCGLLATSVQAPKRNRGADRSAIHAVS